MLWHVGLFWPRKILLPELVSSHRQYRICLGVCLSDTNRPTQSPHPPLPLWALGHYPLPDWTNHPKARYQTTRDSPKPQSPLKLCKPANPKAVYPVSPVPFHGNYNKASFPCFLSPPSASWQPRCFPLWLPGMVCPPLWATNYLFSGSCLLIHCLVTIAEYWQYLYLKTWFRAVRLKIFVAQD